MMTKMISDQTDNDNDVNGTVVQDSGASSGGVTTRQYVPGRHHETGCDSLSLSSNHQLLETTSSDRSFRKKLNVRFVNINISTLNINTLTCDIKLANAVQEAKKLHLDILALQEVRRTGKGKPLVFDSDSGEIEGWQFVWSGFERKREAGVAFILAPHVKLVDTHYHYAARILSVRVIVHGLYLSLTCCYSPTETGTESSKTIFYRELRKANEELLKYNRFKSVFLGDFNATVGMDSKNSGAWDDVLGSNNSSLIDTNENGESFLKFCAEKNLKIINSIFRTKRIHRGTWLHKPSGLVKRLDYITTRKYISRFISSCRAFRTATARFDTDHHMVKMTLRYPTTCKKLYKPFFTPKPTTRPIVSALHQDENIAKLFSEHLDSKLDPSNIPTDLDVLSQQISSSISDAVQAVCPKATSSKSSPPWEDAELQIMMENLRKDPSNTALRREIREKRKSLKNIFYSKKS